MTNTMKTYTEILSNKESNDEYKKRKISSFLADLDYYDYSFYELAYYSKNEELDNMVTIITKKLKYIIACIESDMNDVITKLLKTIINNKRLPHLEMQNEILEYISDKCDKKLYNKYRVIYDELYTLLENKDNKEK